jgi:glycosyltransferase involved in cell wall biosynthesis
MGTVARSFTGRYGDADLMKVCLGILARNEADRILKLIADIARQTLLANNGVSIGLYVVANGCTDATAEVAEKGLSDIAVAIRGSPASVYSLPRAGKANAWNEFIHTVVPPDTDYVFLLDADIRIPEREALQRMVDRLSSSERAVVAIGESVSHLSLRKAKSVAEWLIKAGTGTANDPHSALSGALYCARYGELVKIWMPIGLPVENGFLRAMIMTSRFSEAEDVERLVFVEGARHIFESECTVRGVFRHNVRLKLGTALNVLLFNYLRKLAAEGVDPAQYVYKRNLRDAAWLNSLAEEELRRSTYFGVYKGVLLARLSRLKRLRFKDQLKGLPMLCIGVVFDIILAVRANTLIRRGNAAGFW